MTPDDDGSSHGGEAPVVQEEEEEVEVEVELKLGGQSQGMAEEEDAKVVVEVPRSLKGAADDAGPTVGRCKLDPGLKARPGYKF